MDRGVIISDAKEYTGVLLHRTANRFAIFTPECRQSPINLPGLGRGQVRSTYLESGFVGLSQPHHDSAGPKWTSRPPPDPARWPTRPIAGPSPPGLAPVPAGADPTCRGTGTGTCAHRPVLPKSTDPGPGAGTAHSEDVGSSHGMEVWKGPHATSQHRPARACGGCHGSCPY